MRELHINQLNQISFHSNFIPNFSYFKLITFDFSIDLSETAPMPLDGHPGKETMEISTITTERLGNDSLQFPASASAPSKTNLITSSSSSSSSKTTISTAITTTMTTSNSLNFDLEQQQQNNDNKNSTNLNSSQTSSCNSKVVNSTSNNFYNVSNNGNNNKSSKDDRHNNNHQLHDDNDELTIDVKLTLDSLLGRVDAESYPIVTATTSQSLIYDSCTKVPLISPVKDEDLNKTNDIVMLRNLEVTPPPYTTPSPNLNKDSDEDVTNSTARNRRAAKRTQSEQSDESSSTTTTSGGRSKRQRKQTELFQVQIDPKKLVSIKSNSGSPAPSSSRKSKPEPKPQIRQVEPEFHDVIFYERGDHLAIRNEENTFFLCQLAENVRVQRPFVKVRWLDTENDGRTYFLTSHFDKVPQKSIIMPVVLEKLSSEKKSRQQFTINDQIKDSILDRLKRSLNVQPNEE